jgi:hypothetical protein
MRAFRVTRRRVVSALGAGVILLAAAACEPAVEPLDPSLRAGILTPEHADHYGLTLANGTVTAAAPTSNQGSNTRVAFWQAADQRSVDHQSCSTWVDAHSDLQQQGAALRIRTAAATGRTKAITVTNNIFYQARWVFNVHVMDSAMNPRFRQIASFDLSQVFRPGGPSTFNVPPYPWRMCARVVGDTLSFIVWPLTHAEPSWNDPRYGGSVVLPAGWGLEGTPGWYIGHLAPGDSVGFTERTTANVSPQPATASPSSPSSRTQSEVVAPEPSTPPRQPTWIPRAP